MTLPRSVLIAERMRVIATRIAVWAPVAVFAILSLGAPTSSTKLIVAVVAASCWSGAGAAWVFAYSRSRVSAKTHEQPLVPCERCGYLVASNMQVCPECGTQIDYQSLLIKWGEARWSLVTRRSGALMLVCTLAVTTLAIALTTWYGTAWTQGSLSTATWLLLILVVVGPPLYAVFGRST
jgi:hypothetical protein